MKTIILFTIILFLSNNAIGQSYYNIGEHTVTVSSDNTTHTYKYSNDDFYIDLHNITNKYTNIPMSYTDGSNRSINHLTLEFIPQNGAKETYNKMVLLCDSIITQIDGESVRKNINHHEPLFVEFAVNSSTGKIEEVSYTIPVGDGFDNVSPKSYWHLDLAFKNDISFIITDQEKLFNYLSVAYRIYLPEKK